MDFIESLKQYQRAIEKQLAAFIERKRQDYATREVERWVYDVLGDFVLRGGKRIRAIMAVTAYEGATGAFGDARIILPASALEFLDAYFLVQDDVIDDSDLRRRGPSAHIMLRDYAVNVTDAPTEEAVTFGRNVAIGVGDIYNAWAIECILESDFPPDRKLAALATYNSACEVICRGEIKDIYLGLSNVTATEDDYLDMIREKTVFYVTRNQALMGLDLAGASDELKEAVVRFAEPMGMAFQIRDDILDITSTEAELGKPIGTDVREGKDTLLIIHAREYASEPQWREIAGALGNGEAADRQIVRVREVLHELGSIDYAQHRMQHYLSEAEAALAELSRHGFHEQTIAFYRGMTEFIGSRRH